jgi:hypothetical protein
MISKEFIAQLLDAELARAAKFEDQRLLFREDVPAGRSARSAAALLETDDPRPGSVATTSAGSVERCHNDGKPGQHHQAVHKD